jgi:hypothetical protein
MFNLFNDVLLKRGIYPTSVGDNTVWNSDIIDTQGADQLLWGLLTGSIADADATFAVTVIESDNSDMSGSTAVPAANLTSNLSSMNFQFDSDNTVRKIQVNPTKRYQRLVVTPSNNTSAALFAVFAMLYGFNYLPVTQTAS